MSMASQPLAGRRVLIVEDRYLIASEMADEVRRLGAEVVGPSPDLARARDLITGERLDAALLDINLDGELVFPLADLLARRNVPFVFLTGYDEDVLPEAWHDRPKLTKPIDARDLRRALLAVTAA